MPRDRNIPSSGLAYDGKWWSRFLDMSEKVAVYFVTNPDTLDIIGYYDTVSAANTAAIANVNAEGAYPRVDINWFHSTITHIRVGPIQHPDARVNYPSWIDADPIG
jgi:hypothetical protein